MAVFESGVVAEVLSERPGIQRVRVEMDDGTMARAYVISQLTADVAVGDQVLCNTTAVGLGLGTGGWHVVSTNLTRGAYATPGGGHIMKLRYTPMQLDTGAAEEHLGSLPDRIEDAVVVACTVHSQVPAVIAGIRSRRPETRIAYVMTDGASLPLAFSGLVGDMVERGWLRAGTLTAGHAFGGDREAVGVPSALALARHDADAEVAVLCARASSGDARPRHQGLSHHAATILDLVRSRVSVPIPPGLAAAVAPWHDRHDCVVIPDVSGAELLESEGMHVTTMGRTPRQDELFFDAAAAAGVHAAALVP